MASVTEIGLGRTMERKLRAVGILSAEELRSLGSRAAVMRLKAAYPGTCVVILYHLEAALRGVEIKQLGADVKRGLKKWFLENCTPQEDC